MLEGSVLELATQVGQALQKQERVLATAESCTGGLVAGAITAIAGSSNWFDRGFITYSNAAKVAELGVSEATLAMHGAVSEATAVEMASGALRASAAQVAVSTTGIAGPGGETPGKPVGMVCFGWAWQTEQGVRTHSATHVFSGDRTAVRMGSVAMALRGVLDLIDQGEALVG